MDNSYTFFVEPETIEIPSTAKLPLAFDLTPWIEVGDVISLPLAKLLRDPQQSQYVAGVSSLGVSGNILTVIVTALEPGQNYILLVSATLSASKMPTAALRIVCPI